MDDERRELILWLGHSEDLGRMCIFCGDAVGALQLDWAQ